MPYPLTIPFQAFELSLTGDLSLVKPASDMEALQITRDVVQVAKKYEKLLQEKVLDQGIYQDLIGMVEDFSYQKTKIAVSFPEAKNQVNHPAFSIHFDVFYREKDARLFGIVPAINESFVAESTALLEKAVYDTVHLNFSRLRKLQSVQSIISAIWYESIQLTTVPMQLTFYGPTELETVQAGREDSMLLQATQPFRPPNGSQTFGREAELAQLEGILKGKFLKNILLVGPPGIGKTALIEEMVWHLDSWKVEKQVFVTTASTLIKELTRETGWEDNLITLLQELTRVGGILYVRNLMELFEVGQYEGNTSSIANHLQNALNRGEIILVSECNPEELHQIELRQPGYTALFHIMHLQEPQPTKEVIAKKAALLAASDNISLERDAIEETVRLFRRFYPYSGFPGKPIRYLENLILLTSQSKSEANITKHQILKQFCEESGIPRFMIDPDQPMDLERITDFFQQRLFGQPEAIQQVVNVLATIKTALTQPGKPIASFLFVGPTGVGKTEMAKTLSEFMFGTQEKMIRFDMSEYTDSYSIMRLTGTGGFSDGTLTSAVRREPFCVLLLDEVEKVHPNFFDLLLQILSEGRLTDSRGRTVNFCTSIIIMTSNIGTDKVPGQTIGWKWGQVEVDYRGHFLKAVENYFKPEIYNRMDQIIPFRPLSAEVMEWIVRLSIQNIRKREGIKYRPVQLSIEPDVIAWLAEKSYNPQYGARFLHRILNRELVLPLARQLNGFEMDDKLEIHIDRKDQELQISIESDAQGINYWLEKYEHQALADIASSHRRDMENLLTHSIYRDFLENVQERALEDNLQGSDHLYVQRFGQLEAKAQRLQDAINQLEDQMTICILRDLEFAESMEQSLNQWAEEFFNFKLSLLQFSNPEIDLGFLAIFSPEPEYLVSFYLQICDLAEFECEELFVVWMGHPTTSHNFMKQGEYLLQSEIYAPGWHPILPTTEKGLKCAGVILPVSGTAADLFFQQEQGIHIWEINEKKSVTNRIIWYPGAMPELPPNLGRKDFFKPETPRRHYRPDKFRDSQLKINREINRKQLPVFLMPKLQESFAEQIEEMLYR